MQGNQSKKENLLSIFGAVGEEVDQACQHVGLRKIE